MCFQLLQQLMGDQGHNEAQVLEKTLNYVTIIIEIDINIQPLHEMMLHIFYLVEG